MRFVDNCFPHHGYIWNYGAIPQACPNIRAPNLPTPQLPWLPTCLRWLLLKACWVVVQTWENPEEVDSHTGEKGDNDPVDICELGQRVRLALARWVVLGFFRVYDIPRFGRRWLAWVKSSRSRSWVSWP